jgi:hypothetical protein
MQLLLLLPLAYYFIGVCYTYEVYKELDWIDYLRTNKQIAFVVIVYPLLWVVFYMQPRVKRLRQWVIVKKSHYQNRIIR